MNNKKKAYPEPAERAWVVSVNMGYGHQRTAYPLGEFAESSEASQPAFGPYFDGRIINANDYQNIPEKDRSVWEASRKFYEFISKFKRVPLIGDIAFSLFDKFQRIPTFYPNRDLSKPTFSLKRIFSTIKAGWGEDLISKLKKKENLPIITTFFISAFMAEVFGYRGDIFCVICDADISRAWASLEPRKSRIKYFASNSWTVNRLKLYGVKKENIFLTGFPLPIENIGTEKQEILKEDLGYRLLNLDPLGKFLKFYRPLVDKYVGSLPKNPNHPLTILFSVGGAGAQKEIAIEYLKSLSEKIKKGEIKIILSAGIKEEVKEYFLESIKKLNLESEINRGIEIVFEKEIGEYFKKFNQKLRKTDILWTKPSELSFYTGLGIPIIIAPPIGSQEDFNLKWLEGMGAGVKQKNPKYAHQWIPDFLASGRFAECAMRGFIEAGSSGTYNIKKICLG